MIPSCVGQFCCKELLMPGYSGDSGDFALKR